MEYAFKGAVLPLRTFPLYKKVSSLRSLRGGGAQYGYTLKKGIPVAIEPESLQSPQFIVEETFYRR